MDSNDKRTVIIIIIIIVIIISSISISIIILHCICVIYRHGMYPECRDEHLQIHILRLFKMNDTIYK
jgi:hypothetical protein